jgi:hypothetical protein
VRDFRGDDNRGCSGCRRTRFVPRCLRGQGWLRHPLTPICGTVRRSIKFLSPPCIDRPETTPLVFRPMRSASRQFLACVLLRLLRPTLPDQSQARFLSCPLSQHCFGALAAPGACEASALPTAPFRFWLPRAGPPRKAAKQLLVWGAAPTRFRVPETEGQKRRNVWTSIESL